MTTDASTTLTPLRRQLAGEAADRSPAALDAFLAARRRFVAGERLDMTALAAELGVNRVTLYRWVGSREQLLVEVVWSLARRTLDDLIAAHPRGADRQVRILMGFLEATLSHPGMQRWLAEEGESAMRLLTRHDTDFQPRLIAAVESLLDPDDPDRHEVAYALVRVIESYTYLDLITGEHAGGGAGGADLPPSATKPALVARALPSEEETTDDARAPRSRATATTTTPATPPRCGATS